MFKIQKIVGELLWDLRVQLSFKIRNGNFVLMHKDPSVLILSQTLRQTASLIWIHNPGSYLAIWQSYIDVHETRRKTLSRRWSLSSENIIDLDRFYWKPKYFSKPDIRHYHVWLQRLGPDITDIVISSTPSNIS